MDDILHHLAVHSLINDSQHGFLAKRYCLTNFREILPARRNKRGNSYGNVAGWLAGWVGGWLAVTLRYCIKTAKPI